MINIKLLNLTNIYIEFYSLHRKYEHEAKMFSLEDLNKLCEKHDAGSLKKMLRQEIQYQKATSDERQPRTARAIQG